MSIDLATEFPLSRIPAAHISGMPLRSPLRYPGGKTWLIPHLREWLGSLEPRPMTFIEPFCGGATASLLAVVEQFTERAVMVDLDERVATFWRCVLDHPDELCERIESFAPSRENVERLLSEECSTDIDRAFRTLVRNRTSRAGIIAEGAAPLRRGEGDKGIASRWYPETLMRRIRDIEKNRHRFSIHHGDGIRYMIDTHKSRGVALFIDPPYTLGGSQPGARLYQHPKVDHARIFEGLAQSEAEFMMTYHECSEANDLVRDHGFAAARVQMRTAHGSTSTELVITRQSLFE